MKVSIFGLGYVGSVTAACLATQGHRVIGVDVVDEKVDSINAGRWPIFEPGLDELGLFRKGLVMATKEIRKALMETEISLVCVGTPSRPDGDVDLTYLKKTVSTIARILKTKKSRHVLLIRSTCPPGTNESMIFPLLSPAQRKLTAFVPEFLREGTALRDFFEPSLNVVGCKPGFPVSVMKKLLPKVKAPLEVVDVSTAESIKYANNSFHALKIVFTNEIATLCRARGADADRVMELFCKDTKLNLSPYYMKPGFAFGGSCLPKELRGLCSMMQARNHEPVLFEAILRANERLISSLVSLIYRFKPDTVGYVGVTFKPNTDDLRESPVMRAVELVQSQGRSYAHKIRQLTFDNPKAAEKIRATNAGGLTTVDSLAALVKASNVIVLGPYKLDAKGEALLARCGKPVIDLKWFRYGAKLTGSKKYHSLV